MDDCLLKDKAKLGFTWTHLEELEMVLSEAIYGNQIKYLYGKIQPTYSKASHLN